MDANLTISFIQKLLIADCINQAHQQPRQGHRRTGSEVAVRPKSRDLQNSATVILEIELLLLNKYNISTFKVIGDSKDHIKE